MKHSEALKAAKEIISLPENWMQKWYYKDAEGNHVAHRSEAVCFCSYGALRKANNVDIDTCNGAIYLRKVLQLENPIEYVDISDYNDSHSHTEVLALFDKAIELAEKAGE